ncbi:hypothetical protein RND71_011403 [Anisodus tanguticus]|uniref:Uncharacterized protein n=1 Tax=Anisodus tanguticus TaxID=243964 RepID=A0AAE1SEV0_9SOLA|nr:hypothetical protein RND71_011403 [Anisodus tanguticus]
MAAPIIIGCQDQTLKASLAKYHITEPSQGIGRIIGVISLKQMDAFPRDPQVVSGLRQELANQMKAAAMDSEILSNEVAKLLAEVSTVDDTLKMNHTLVLHESSKEFFSFVIGTVMFIGIWDPEISSTFLCREIRVVVQYLGILQVAMSKSSGLSLID